MIMPTTPAETQPVQTTQPEAFPALEQSKDISLVFFGSGPVAAQSLELLLQNFTIEAVVTKPKPEAHSGDFPVLQVAERHNLKTFTTANKRELSDLFAAKPATSRVGVVVDYGIIIPQAVIDYFPLGIVNSHFSLLPEWRGADPITFSILSGQAQTGISLMLIVAAMDEGPLLAQSPFTIPPNMTTPELTDALIEVSYQTLSAVLPMYVAGHIQPVPQDTTVPPSYSRKLTKADGLIDWHKPAEVIEREVRAYAGWPKSRTTLAGKEVALTQAHVLDETGEPGKATAKGRELVVYCGDKALVLDKLKPAGKNEMTSEAFLAGHRSLL
jgi:methionyl-tRNA formyltransferase